jgi:hypothetical protein
MPNHFRFLTLSLCVYLLLGETIVAAQQDQSASLAEKIDSIVAQWNSNQTPGYAVGVIRTVHFSLPGVMA